MKSIILSIIIFIIVFTSLELGILKIIDNGYMLYIGIGTIIISLICGMYFVGIPRKKDFLDNKNNKGADK